MRFTRPVRWLLAPAIALSLAGTALAVPVVYNIGIMPGGSYTALGALSADGNVVTGFGDTTVPSGSNTRPFRWVRPNGPAQVMPVPTGWGEGRAASFAGQHIVGLRNGSVATLWTTSTLLTLANLPGGTSAVANSVNTNASFIAGTSSTASGNRAVRWNSAGVPTNLGLIPGATGIRPATVGNGISASGATVVGAGDIASGVSRAFRWNAPAGPMQNLGTLSGGQASAALAVSGDNTTVVGWSYITGTAIHAFRHRATTGMQNLGTIGTDTWCEAKAVTSNGGCVVGKSYSITQGWRASIWTPQTGMQELRAYALAQGANVTGWVFEEANGISSNGTCISGAGTFNGQPRAFLICGLPCVNPVIAWIPNPTSICVSQPGIPPLPANTATLSMGIDASDPVDFRWSIIVEGPGIINPEPEFLVGEFYNGSFGLSFDVQGFNTSELTISNLRPGAANQQISFIGHASNPCGNIATVRAPVFIAQHCAPPPPVGCAIADVASDSLDIARNPNNAIGPEDLDAFIAGFITDNVSIADVVSDALDTTYNPNGAVGPEDLDAFIASFIVGC